MHVPPPVLVVGNAVLDIILTVDHYPQEDEEMRALSHRSDLGGNAANTARVLAALGHPVTLLTTLAQDADALSLRRLLDGAGVDSRHVVTASAGHTPVSYILLHEAHGSRTIIHHRDLAELEVEDFLALPLREYGWIHFEGRNVEAVGGMLDHLHETGYSGRISLEIEKNRPGLVNLSSRVDLVLTSRAYAHAKHLHDAPALLAHLRPTTDGALTTCTWGEEGAWAMSPEGSIHHCAGHKPVVTVDTLGAGDVFSAGMIHALAMGNDAQSALEFSTRLAGKKVGISGFAGLVE